MRFTTCSLTLAIVLLTVINLAGCKREITLHSYDKAAIEALEKYAPERVLDNNGRVVELKLENKELDEAAFEQLRKLTAMRTLSLYGSTFSDASLEKLQDVGQLQAIGLGATPVTDKGLSYLAKLPGLHYMWLNGRTGVTPQGIADLKKALPELTVFE